MPRKMHLIARGSHVPSLAPKGQLIVARPYPQFSTGAVFAPKGLLIVARHFSARPYPQFSIGAVFAPEGLLIVARDFSPWSA